MVRGGVGTANRGDIGRGGREGRQKLRTEVAAGSRISASKDDGDTAGTQFLEFGIQAIPFLLKIIR